MLPAATPVKTAIVIGELLHSKTANLKKVIKYRKSCIKPPGLSPLSFILGNSNVAPGNSN